MRGEIGLEPGRIKPDRLVPNGDEVGLRLGVGAAEEGHLMAEFDQSLGQEGYDPLGAAVEFWGNRLIKRRNLRDLHLFSVGGEGEPLAVWPAGRANPAQPEKFAPRWGIIG